MAKTLLNSTTYIIYNFTNISKIFFEWRYIDRNDNEIRMILHYIDRFPHFVRKPEIQFYTHDALFLSKKC